MAHQVLDLKANSKILIANDARMGEVYWATFQVKTGELIRLSDDALNAPEDVKTTEFEVCAGSAFQQMITVSHAATDLETLVPDAVTLLQIGEVSFQTEAQNIMAIKPTYIREKVVFN